MYIIKYTHAHVQEHVRDVCVYEHCRGAGQYKEVTANSHPNNYKTKMCKIFLN